ncbi:MAG: hypothetical protein ABIH59_01230 [archaeon]
MKKRGQMKLSFGMIFSIILIIAFLVFAFYAIRMFLGVTDSAKIVKFRENLQEDIDDLWKGTKGSQRIGYELPGKIEKVCFKDPERDYEYNLIFEPEDSVGGVEPININNIDIDKITEDENPYCIENKNRKINILLKKDFGDELVILERA